MLIISILIYYNNKYIKYTINLVLHYGLNAISLYYQLTIKTKEMENYYLSKRVDNVKNDFEKIIDDLIEEIETLESEKVEMNKKIDALENEKQDLKNEIGELKSAV